MKPCSYSLGLFRENDLSKRIFCLSLLIRIPVVSAARVLVRVCVVLAARTLTGCWFFGFCVPRVFFLEPFFTTSTHVPSLSSSLVLSSSAGAACSSSAECFQNLFTVICHRHRRREFLKKEAHYHFVSRISPLSFDAGHHLPHQLMKH